jgi:hypothetical protein
MNALGFIYFYLFTYIEFNWILVKETRQKLKIKKQKRMRY